MSDSGGKRPAPSLFSPSDGEDLDLDDQRPCPDNEDDHSDTGFDLDAELSAEAGAAPDLKGANQDRKDADQDSAEALFPEFVRPSPDDEDDHSDANIDLDAEIERQLGEEPVNADDHSNTGFGLDAALSAEAAPVSDLKDADQDSKDAGPDSAEALFPEFVRPCPDDEDDHSDANIDLDAEIERQLGEGPVPEILALENSSEVHPGLTAALAASYSFAVRGLPPDENPDDGDVEQDPPLDQTSGRSPDADPRNLAGLGVDDDSRYAQEPEDSGDDDLPPLPGEMPAPGATAGAGRDLAGEDLAPGPQSAPEDDYDADDDDDGAADDDEDGCCEDEDDGEGDDDGGDAEEDEEDEDEDDDGEEGSEAEAGTGQASRPGPSRRGGPLLRLLIGLPLLGLLVCALYYEQIHPLLPPAWQELLPAPEAGAQKSAVTPAAPGSPETPAPAAPQAPAPQAPAPQGAVPGTAGTSAAPGTPGTPAAPTAPVAPAASDTPETPAPERAASVTPETPAPAAPQAPAPQAAAPFGFMTMANLLPVIFFVTAFFFIAWRIWAGEKKPRVLSVKEYQAARKDAGTGKESDAQNALSPARTASAPDDSEEENEEDAAMSFADHFRELRKRFFRIFIVLLAGFFICWPFAEQLFSLLTLPLLTSMPKGSTFIFTSPPEAFFTYMKVALVAGFFAASPLIFYQVWAFVAPGLYREERLYILPVALFSAFFFIGGGAFCYFVVFPFAFEFFMSYNTGIIQAMPALSETLSFVLKLLIAFGLVFEMPLFAFFLGRMGLLSADTLRRFRRYAVLVLFIVAAILTPPDVVSQLLMAGPLLLLYEVSILIVAAFGRKKPATEKDEDEDEDDEDDEEDEEEDNADAERAAARQGMK